MSEEEIEKIALKHYPIDEFWIGSGESARLYDQNKRDRIVFTKGIKVALKNQEL